jgi:hypothetical protein
MLATIQSRSNNWLEFMNGTPQRDEYLLSDVDHITFIKRKLISLKY